MKLFRLGVALAVLAYAGWLAWSVLPPMLEAAGPAGAVIDTAGRGGGPADLLGAIPAWWLWLGAAALYLIAAMMLGAGNPKAMVAYFLGFIADAVLRLAIGQGGGSDSPARSSGPTPMATPDALSGLPVDPLLIVLGGLLILGLLVVIASRRIGRGRTPGQLTG